MIIDKLYEYLNRFKGHSNVHKGIVEVLNKCVILDAQNACNYFFQGDEEIVTVSSFSKCFSPWEYCLLKYKHPSYSYSKECGRVEQKYRPECVMIVKAIHEKDGSTMEIIHFTEIINGGLEMLGTSIHKFDSNLNMIPDYNKDGESIVKVIANIADSRAQSFTDFISTLSCKVALFAFTFCNCKNVIRKENFYDKNFIKRRARENKFPITKYYTLEIDNKTKDRANKSGIGGWSNSAHICRGHFKHYTEEAPLFGHYTGTVWCPMHLKGDENIGTIKKDYKI